MNLNLGWKFYRGDEPKAWLKDFDDSLWQNVVLPHDWSVTEPFSEKHSSGTGYLPAGIGWYRKSFTLSEEDEGKRVYITFDGVYNNSEVWVNSYYLGKHPNGYTAFTYDLTDFVCFGKIPNNITVRVNHKYEADSRWFTGSGIYRKVTLQIKDQICIDKYGVFVTTPVAEKEESIINTKVTVTNHTNEEEIVTIKHNLIDGEKVLVSNEVKQIIGGSERRIMESDMIVSDVKLWSPDEPYLYKLLTEIIKDGIIIDQEVTIIGIRTFRFDSDKGFFLNNRNMKIKGVCVHHDAGCLGAAVRPKVWERRLKKLKDMGCNAIRMSHNPHMPELYDLCDKMGFLVDDEAFDEWEGVKNKWHIGHNVYPPAHYGYAEDFPEWHERDLRELVLRDRNHPSIIMWSIGNEIDYPNDPYCHPYFKEMVGNNDHNKPAQERVYNPNKPNAERLTTIAKKLTKIVKECDETRPVTLASAFPELSHVTGLTDAVDIIGYNYKEHLYEQDHKTYPKRILIGSENGHGQKAWLAVKENDYIPSQFLWTGIDYLGETSGWPYHGSGAGLLDIGANEKASYYLRKSWWNEEPMVHLATAYGNIDIAYHHEYYENWNYCNKEVVNVNCYTNCDKVELYINNKLIETKHLKDFKELLYIPFKVSFEVGEIKAVGYKENRIVSEYTIKTTNAPVKINACVHEEQIQANQQDMTHIEVNVVDDKGNRVITAENMLTVEINGPGTLMGIENGNLADYTPYSCNYRRTHNGRLVVFISSTKDKGVIQVKISSSKLKESIVKIMSL
ncbi:MAG: glycoside hydrolase family 2 TIM barrel-domain containing protein [Cellulosilyticaceae bacterium]